MKKNVGSADRTVRLVVAVLIAVLYFTDTITGTLAVVLAIIALILLITGLSGACPGYRVLGWSTRKE